MQPQTISPDAQTKPITVVVVDDHPLIHEAVQSLIDKHEDIELVGTGLDGDDVFHLVETHKPDILLLDLEMPQSRTGNTGQRFRALPTIAQLRKKYPQTAPIILSQHLLRPLINRAVEYGLRGYLLKSDGLSLEVPDAVRRVSQGGLAFSETIRQQVFAENNSTNSAPVTAGNAINLVVSRIIKGGLHLRPRP